MTNQLLHRGPDGIGYFNDNLISLGHTRLSVMDLSDTSAQPFSDPTGRFVLVFNGELYNYASIRNQLRDYSFVSDGDTEVLLAAFIKWGINCLHNLDGIFAFALWDSQEQTLWIARDRLGVKPLYYAQPEGIVVFSSELRAILASELVPRYLNRNSLTGYFQFQSAGYPGMLIDDINELPPGHFVKLNGGGIDISPYWNLEPKVFDKNKYLNQSDIEKHLFHLLHNAVTSRMVSAVPTGVFLSGGVDSSAITAIMSLYQNDPVNTFTLHLDDVRLDEAKNAAQFAKLYSCQHHNIVVNSVDCHIQVANFLSKVDSPSMDGLNTYLISAAASNAGMRVMLSGLGGDELFAGYPGFRFAKQLQQFKMIFDNTRLLRKMIASGFSGLHLLKAFPLFRLLSANSHNISDSYPAFRQVMSLGETRKYIKADENPSLKITQKILDFEKSDEDLQLGMYSLAEYTHYAVNTLLRDNDQVGMANSIEIREPFFDYNLIEFVAGLPDTLKLGKYPKQLLVDAMYPLLPKEINMQTKKGFVLPMEKWMRNELRDLCEKSIYSICDRDFIHRSNLLEAWRNFLNGHYGVRWTTMWQFVVLGAWMDKNNIS